MSYTLFHSATAAINPADSARNILVIGANNYLSSLTGNDYHFAVPFDGTITKVQFTHFISGTLSSGEDQTVGFVVNGVDYPVSTQIETNATKNAHSIIGLNIPVNAGDDIYMYTTNPVWATNPTGSRVSMVAYVNTGDAGDTDFTPVVEATSLIGGAFLFLCAMAVIMFYFKRK